MYWIRMGSALAPLVWLSLCGLWWLGGWLIASHAFRLERRERLAVGFGLGLAGYLWFANLLAHWLSPAVAFSAAAFLVAAWGVALALRGGNRPFVDWGDLHAWPLGLAGLALGWLFFRVSQGLAIFDDYMHLPLISTMAAENIPPRYFLNARVPFAYHYGFQLLGASLMRLGGLFPWSAFDLSKALLWAYALLLAYLLGRRLTHRPLGGVATAALLVFAGGTRYLTLLLPPAFLQSLDASIQFQGAEVGMQAAFSTALTGTWVLDGGPPLPFPFAFLSGIGRPLVMAHAGLNLLGVSLLLLAWLLSGRANQATAGATWLILGALWGLSWETGYIPVLAGYALIALHRLRQERRLEPPPLLYETLGMLLAVPVSLIQGGLLTELARKLLWPAAGAAQEAASTTSGLAGFSLRWPPAIVSAHLGPLSLLAPRETLLGLLELGPIILFAPWITLWARRRYRSGSWIAGVLIASAWIAFLVPLFVRYQSDTDIARITEHGVQVWLIYLGAMLFERPPATSRLLRYAAASGLALMAFGGVVLAGSVLSAAQRPLLSYRFTLLDARMARDLWDQLPAESQVFDSRGWRATALTGRLTRAVTGDLSFGNQPDPAWEMLRQDPSVAGFLAQGYDFVYLDEAWWRRIPAAARDSLNQGCVRTLAGQQDEATGEFRRLLDLRGCAP